MCVRERKSVCGRERVRGSDREREGGSGYVTVSVCVCVKEGDIVFQCARQRVCVNE